MNKLFGVSFLLGFQLVIATGEIASDPYDNAEILESPIIIQDDEKLKSIRTQNGDIRYRVQFLGKDYCVQMTEPNPLDSFDVGATYWIPCY